MEKLKAIKKKLLLIEAGLQSWNKEDLEEADKLISQLATKLVEIAERRIKSLNDIINAKNN